jgi:pimeloyl-ACP methyl ester carboxylesterase
MPSVLLIHGGLWEATGADWFWRRTGVIDGLAGRGLTVVGGSFGCAAAVRLALDFPRLVGRLVLAWPASTAAQFDRTRFRAALARPGAPAAVLDTLLGTETLPSASDDELRVTAAVHDGAGCGTASCPVIESRSWSNASWWHRTSSRAACPRPT